MMGKGVLIPREVLENLDELCAYAEMDSFGEDMQLKNPKLNKLAGEVYKAMHWYLQPNCRRNHPSWNPLKVTEAPDSQQSSIGSGEPPASQKASHV